MTEFFREDDRGSNDGTRQRAPARFIDPGDASHAISAKFFLVAKSAAPVHRAENTENLKMKKLKDYCASAISEFTRERPLLPCLCESEDNSVWRGEHVPLARPQSWRCALSATGKRARHLPHRKFGAR